MATAGPPDPPLVAELTAMLRPLAIGLVVIGLACCAGHRPAVVLPAKGVEVDVKVRIGKDALEGGTLDHACAMPPSNCTGPCLSGCCRGMPR